MLAVTIDGYALSAIVIIGIFVVLLARLLVRMMRDHGVRITRVGIFIERERFDKERQEREERVEQWTPDPLVPSRGQETVELPASPPDHGYPHRKEDDDL